MDLPERKIIIVKAIIGTWGGRVRVFNAIRSATIPPPVQPNNHHPITSFVSLSLNWRINRSL